MASAALARRTPQPHRSVSPRHRFADEGERNGEQYSARLRKAISPYSVARRQKAETLVAQERARAGQVCTHLGVRGQCRVLGAPLRNGHAV
jgi:hypothetical protein